ncbi:FTS and Hook-interacting protein [Platysternon megacephalum]|uniref:FTS and Hook-interacting protein n=1 Tax=Platysternon megacephalum TaxID=55544 RepID=A0A4D9DQQ4_9SAUR|nr:FTS and Hook-interacting protein [Platysternon megacephalum]
MLESVQSLLASPEEGSKGRSQHTFSPIALRMNVPPPAAVGENEVSSLRRLELGRSATKKQDLNFLKQKYKHKYPGPSKLEEETGPRCYGLELKFSIVFHRSIISIRSGSNIC